jgi:hypothetical protein
MLPRFVDAQARARAFIARMELDTRPAYTVTRKCEPLISHPQCFSWTAILRLCAAATGVDPAACLRNESAAGEMFASAARARDTNGSSKRKRTAASQ